MKNSITSLVLAYIISAVAVYVSEGGVYTVLVIFAVQTILFSFTRAHEAYRSGVSSKYGLKAIQYSMTAIMTIIASAALFFIIAAGQGASFVSNGVEKTVDLGELSLLSVILSSTAFLYVYSRQTREHYQSFVAGIAHSFVGYILLFFRNASLIVLLFAAIELPNQRYTALGLLSVKFSVDLLEWWLEKNITKKVSKSRAQVSRAQRKP